jgi:hypothetical protein
MRILTGALALAILVFSIPCSSESAQTVGLASPGIAHYSTIYADGRDNYHDLDPQRPHRGHLWGNAPGAHYAPHDAHRDTPKHYRYYDMHGYWSPTWRYPRSLHYHQHAH